MRWWLQVGVRKWLSEGVADGLCQVVQVWELSSDDPHSLIWKIRSTTVAVGNTSGFLCAPMKKAAP